MENKIDLSIIIAHYRGDENCSEALPSLLESIKNQDYKTNYEILIADDGSPVNKKTFIDLPGHSPSETAMIKHLSPAPAELLKFYNIPSDVLPSVWAYYDKPNGLMGKAKVQNYCCNLAQGKYLLFLDDDNILQNSHALTHLMELLEKNYDLVIGQIIDNNGRKRTYESNRVQGTTFSMTKELFARTGGFGEWTEKIGCAVDSDIWWKLFQIHQFKTYSAIYSEILQTKDTCSGRWKKHLKSVFREFQVRRQFFNRYSLKNYKSAKFNLSRKKNIWIEKE